MWALLVSTGMMIGAVLLLFRFFARQPIAPPEDILSRLSLISIWALVLSAAAMLLSASGLLSARNKSVWQKWPLRVLCLLPLILAVGIFGSALFSQSMLGSIPAMPGPKARASNPLLDRMGAAAAVVIVLDEKISRYRPTMRMGVVIASRSDQSYVLTTLYVDKDKQRGLPASDPIWVKLSDGRSVMGHLRWTAELPINLALIEVGITDPPGRAEIHPLAVATVPGAEVLSIQNPLHSGWVLNRGTVLRRERLPSAEGLSTLLITDLPLYDDDNGGGLYYNDGRLIGLNTGSDNEGLATQTQLLSIETTEKILNAIDSGKFDQLDNSTSKVTQP